MNEIRFDGKVAVVTGATRGIGKMLVNRFSDAGAKVVFCARRGDLVAKLQAELRARGREAVGVTADTGKFEDCQRLIEAAVKAYGTVDILVNSAGVSGVQKPVWELQPDELDEVMKVNVQGPYACTHFAAPHMIRQKSGSIVNIGSFTGKRPMPFRTPYATSKMALVGLTRTVALELAPHKVRCNCISPGPVEGERVEEVVANASKASNRTPEEVRKGFLGLSPMNEMVTEEEICDMTFFLCSEHGRHMTGQDINMTAGIVMY